MNVRALIQRLEKCDPNANVRVVIQDDDERDGVRPETLEIADLVDDGGALEIRLIEWDEPDDDWFADHLLINQK